MWQAPHKEEQRSLQPGSARGHPSHEDKLQPGSARGHPSHENHQGPKRPADTRRFRFDGALGSSPVPFWRAAEVWWLGALAEEAIFATHRPSGWDREQHYVVVRRRTENGQRLLIPRHTVILVSRDDLPLKELVRRHRGKQGQENAFKGPLRDMDLHHPPCGATAPTRRFTRWARSPRSCCARRSTRRCRKRRARPASARSSDT